MAHGLTRTHTAIHGICVGLCGSVAYSLSTRREALQLEHKLSKVMPDMAREKVMQLTNPFIELGIQRGVARLHVPRRPGPLAAGKFQIAHG